MNLKCLHIVYPVRIIGWLLLIILFSNTRLHAQPNTSLEVQKTKQYEDRKLPSEKSADKKFGLFRKLTQNAFTHYNYYFNANEKYKSILEKVQSAWRDDYNQLLPFFNYSLDQTAQDKEQIDSLIYKCNAGILLHDLRNDWIDNMYLLLGKAYLLRKDYDSAYMAFQYINYAYAPKDDGYDVLLGSNSSNTKGIFTISTKEKKSWFKTISGARPPSRNESFIWQARNYIERDELTEASGLLEILQVDPLFPKRLYPELNNMMAYLFYKQQAYDSAANYLIQSMRVAENKADEARRHFLAAQLYQLAEKNKEAEKQYQKAIQKSVDPVMEVYARLNMASISAGKENNAIQNNLNELLKMARRDKYEIFRDIIYYAAAQLELKRNNEIAAKKYLLKSIESSIDNGSQKAKTFLQLADIYYSEKKYLFSYSYYDSTQTNLLEPNKEAIERVNLRKPLLKILAGNQGIQNREDSLQKIAGLSEKEKEVLVKKVWKQLKKEKGISVNDASTTPNNPVNDATIFKTAAGEFYFASNSAKAKGFTEFKATWGNRPNADNWRRQAALDKTLSNSGNTVPIDVAEKETAEEETESLESLTNNIPDTPEKMAASNKKRSKAITDNALVLQNKLEDYAIAAELYETLLRTPTDTSFNREEIIFNLLYCYKKLSLPGKADSLQNLLQKEFPTGKFTDKLNPQKVATAAQAATTVYANIYRQFIEGNFATAIAAKEKADSSYGKNFWTPQLLFIESIYYIKLQKDSVAINRLESLKNEFPSSPMAVKASDMIDVLKRRKEIEKYLTNLNVEKGEDIVVKRVDLNSTDAVKTTAPTTSIKRDSVKVVTPPSTIKPPVNNPAPVILTNKKFSFNPIDTHYVAIILDKVDALFVTEVKNAFNRYNQANFSQQKLQLFPFLIDQQYNFMLAGPFPNAGAAVTYIDKVRPIANSRIIPWLEAGKYSFSIISNPNLSLLQENKEVQGYKQFLKEIFPDKF